MEPLSTIINQAAQRIDHILNHPPRTNRVGNDLVTTFSDGREFKNLTADEVQCIHIGNYDRANHEWREAMRYERYMYYHFTPCADYYLREMREQLIH